MRICRRIHKLTNSVYCKAGIQSKKGRYWTSPTIWRNCVGLENKWSDIMVILEVEIGVSTSLQEVIPAQVRMSMIYDVVRSAVFGSHGRRTIRCWRAADWGGEHSNLGSEGRCNSKEDCAADSLPSNTKKIKGLKFWKTPQLSLSLLYPWLLGWNSLGFFPIFLF